MTNHPPPFLQGLRVLLTRADDGLSPLAITLQGASAEVVPLPLTTIVPLATPLLLKHPPDWLFFTSRLGITHSLPTLQATGWLSSAKIAVVGPSTASFAQQQGLPVAFTPQPPYHGQSAAQQLVQTLTGSAPVNILWPCSALASHDLFAAMGPHSLHPWPVYSSIPRPSLNPADLALLTPPFDWVVLTSPTAAIVWSRLCPEGLRSVPLVSIGPKTTAAIVKHCPTATVREAESATPEAMARAMK
jgi:uroporphyrinogen-III synthase